VDVLPLQQKIRFEQVVLPHLDAGMNLARWLLRNREDAEDVVQEAMLRAYRFFGQFRGGDARAWLLQIVRNSCYTWIEKRRPSELTAEFDEQLHHSSDPDPETMAMQASDREMLTRALESLPPRAREVLVLRELEGCSYKEIADITGVPMGTVMSTLSRARERLQRAVSGPVAKEASSDL
jgi:RNA polymerase sigma-70 factor, ECF subfamily